MTGIIQRLRVEAGDEARVAKCAGEVAEYIKDAYDKAKADCSLRETQEELSALLFEAEEAAIAAGAKAEKAARKRDLATGDASPTCAEDEAMMDDIERQLGWERQAGMPRE